MPTKRNNRKNHKKDTNRSNHAASQNSNSSSQNSNTRQNTKNTKKLKKMDLRGPNWKANLDYINSTSAEKKKNYPVIKGTQFFDLQQEYKKNYKKFMGNNNHLNEIFNILKIPLSSVKSRQESKSQGATDQELEDFINQLELDEAGDARISKSETIVESVSAKPDLATATSLSKDEKLNFLRVEF